MGKRWQNTAISLFDTEGVNLFLQNAQRRFRLVGGYYNIYCPQHPNATGRGSIAVHRLLVEGYIGRYLGSDEVVHHINGNKLDNEIGNLRLMSKTEHRRLHMKDPYNKGMLLYRHNLDVMISLRKQKMTAREISVIVGVPRRTVQRYLKNSGMGGDMIRNIRQKRNIAGRFEKGDDYKWQ